MNEIIKEFGFYKGSVLRFHNFFTGCVHSPFELKKNVLYGVPKFID